MVQPGRKYSVGSGYRYGFNGKENDNEVKGEGNQQDYGFRIYDPRLGRFLSTDPLTKSYPELTPYQFASNRPIDGTDLDGLEYNSTSTYVYHPPVLKNISDNTLHKFPIKEQEIMMSNGLGTTYIGPRSVVESNVAISRQNYSNAVADNIAGGFFGAAGYMIGKEKGSFVGASIDGVVMSFGHIPAGESSVFPKAGIVEPSASTSATEIAPYEHTPVNIVYNAKQGWDKEQVTELYNKAQAISNNPEAKVTIKNPMKRLANTKTNYLKQGGTLTKGQQVDHTTDLQINGNNGADGKTNLGGLNGSVNMSTGSQTYQQIKNLPDGTRVSHALVNPFSH